MLAVGCGQLAAQQNNQLVENTPSWVSMIDNPSVNYFEAVKTYESYWSQNTKPTLVENTVGIKGLSSVNANSNTANNNSLKDLAFEQEMFYQCMRFEQWQKEMRPFVQPDGSLLTEKQLEKIYKQRSISRK